ncbi:low affinity immunoglobulin gamma Fc region receptor II isoform X1 [Oreochromis niloticus]|uniref:Ig-like domain-containing protein n=1 Tax=Oreochromis aureus TaxID=47969 RepID=A0AAZ1WY51_OREAU|nr:low affinity immunoglobulin gamma Fc region receptor II isoform X1 [Oreochromis niloticus]XP_039458600.1 low affinity immunoglobulin gamma Fc region receptor II-like [Oreochromis aureus]
MNVKWLQIDLKASVCALPHPPQQQLCFSENYFHIVVSQRSYRKHLLVGLRQDIMEVRALCIRLLMTVLILLCAQKVDAIFLRIDPNKSQFFEYESVSFYCEEPSHGDVLYKVKEEVEQCNKTTKKTTVITTESKCTIHPLYASDSGEYWCGTAGGKRSNIINITVTAGSVILEIPAVPVMEGEAVTLRCRNKTSSSNTAADFYKNGVHNSSSSSRSMTIHKVLKSDEGLYKCKISGGGESPESWLSVYLPCLIDSHNKRSHCAATTPWIVATILLSTLIAVVGLYHFRKDWYRALVYWSTMAYGSGSTEDQTGQNTNNEVELCPNPVYDSLGQGDTQPLETVKTTVAYMASPGIYQAVAEDPCYSTIP